MSRLLRALITAALASWALLGAACSDDAATQRLSVSGSTTILPIAEMAAEMFQKTEAGTRVLVSGVGSSAGIESVAGGSCDIGTSSRDLKGDEQQLGLVGTPIAYDAIAVIVNPRNPVKGLTKEQVKAIFQGRITNWRQVGGRDERIGLVNRDEASGTREAFGKIVLDEEGFDPSAAVLPGTGQVRSVVGRSPGAIGYISLGFVTDEVEAVAVDGVVPAPESVRAGDYPIQRTLHFLTKGEPTGLAARYIEFVLSEGVQERVIRKAGFLPITPEERR